jgi:hypothetical protein
VQVFNSESCEKKMLRMRIEIFRSIMVGEN